MDLDFNLEEYLISGIDAIIKGALKAAIVNPKESIFITKFALTVRDSHKIRVQHEKNGEHIPPFLIASITNSCNLHCSGCYAWANKICTEHEAGQLLSGDRWSDIFREAGELGISFILLAGGEPLLRRDVIEKAAVYKNIIFPIFTNGTRINDDYLECFDKNRNLIPVLSLEGDEEYTDTRRGAGIYRSLMETMVNMMKKGIFFGTSITVTKENMNHVTGDAFIRNLYQKGCKVIFMVEYVPFNDNTGKLAPGDGERKYLDDRLKMLRKEYKDMIFISFPGDEKSSGGCLAAGRGFFHINPAGGAEPCPFSPYSDTDLTDGSILHALKSPLFKKLSDSDLLKKNHEGGCVLFGQNDKVRKLCQKSDV